MAKLGDWERTVWRNRNTAEERDEPLLCRWRDGPSQQRLEYHYFEQFVQDSLGFEDLEEFIEGLPDDEEENFDEEHNYVVVFGEDAEGDGGEPLQSAPTREAAREAASELMKGEYHPENLFPERYEEEELEIPDDLEEEDDDGDLQYDYDEVQEIAKSHGVKANQSKEDIVNELVDIRDSEDEEGEDEPEEAEAEA